MKKSALNPAAYGLTVDEATRLVRLHDMCAGMAPEVFDQEETAARSTTWSTASRRWTAVPAAQRERGEQHDEETLPQAPPPH